MFFLPILRFCNHHSDVDDDYDDDDDDDDEDDDDDDQVDDNVHAEGDTAIQWIVF